MEGRPKFLSVRCGAFLTFLLQADPERRAAVEDAMEHAWARVAPPRSRHAEFLPRLKVFDSVLQLAVPSTESVPRLDLLKGFDSVVPSVSQLAEQSGSSCRVQTCPNPKDFCDWLGIVCKSRLPGM